MLMGVLNVTPDSFSDGGQFFDSSRAVERGLQMEAEGAEILDVGGESTRPRATPVSEAEELRRVLPVIEKLRAQTSALISIDTMKPKVAQAAVEAGASVINDVGANRAGAEMAEVAAETKAGYVLMHMQGTPATMQDDPAYEDVVGEVTDFFQERRGFLARNGVQAEQVVLDVGIGFGKTMEHNLQLIAHHARFARLGRPMLLGVSRKSFLGRLLNQPVEDRLSGALACASWAVLNNVGILRVHDVKETLGAVRTLEALRARVNA